MDKIYEAIYDVANKNIKETGGEFYTTKAAYSMYVQGFNETSIDIESYLKLDKSIDNTTFLQIVYLSILHRVFVPGECDWDSVLSLPQEECRIAVLNEILNSAEAQALGNKVYDPNKRFKKRVLKGIVNSVLTFLYFKVFLKLPEGLRNIIKKSLGK